MFINPTYTDYRLKFLNCANRLSVEVYSEKIPGLGFKNEELFQDYIYIDKQSEITTVVLSGLHGTEGYIGSEIQCEILENLKKIDFQTNILLVHAVNPFGMSWYRRTNQNNVDLNRNAAFHTQIVQNKNFKYFLPLLSSKNSAELLFQTPIAIINMLIKQLLGNQQHTKKNLKNQSTIQTTHSLNPTQIIASGQYEYEKSLFFGGFETQLEISKLISKMKEFNSHAKIFRVIDIHTGLGPPAFDSLLVTGDSTIEIKYFEKNLSPPHLMILNKYPKYYKANGLLEDALRAEFGIDNIHYVTQEFGTVPFYKVLSSLILENHLYYSGKSTSNRRVQISIEAFYPQNQNWSQQCKKAGLELFKKITADAIEITAN